MIALLCATLLCLATHEGFDPGVFDVPDRPRIYAPMQHPKWRFVLFLYGRAITVDGWESERQCREMRDRTRDRYPDARVSDCEVSR